MKRKARRTAFVTVGVLAAAGTAWLLTAAEHGTSLADAAVTYRPDGVHLDALLEGVLHIADGCLVVTGDGRDVVVAIPSGSTIDEDAGTVRIAGGTTTLGEPASFGGGFTSTPSDRLTIPEACAGRITGAADEVFLVSSMQ